jgi:O-antigen/teichoic acid export membrane protein
MLARLGSAVTVGQFALGYAICTPVFAIANLSLRTIQATDKVKSDFSLSDYLGLRVVTTVAGLAGIISFALLADMSRATFAVVICIAIAKGCEAVSDVLYGFLQHQERMDRIAKSMVIKGVASLIAVTAAMLISDLTVIAAMCIALAWGGLLLIFDFPGVVHVMRFSPDPRVKSLALPRTRAAVIRPRFRLDAFRTLVWLGLPLGIVLLVSTLTLSMPRVLIERQLGIEELGVFTAVSTLIFAGDLIVSSLSQAVMPRLAQHYAAGDDIAFRALAIKCSCLFIIMGILGVLLAQFVGIFLLRTVYGREYVEYAQTFTILIATSAFVDVGGFFNVVIASKRRFWAPFPVNLLKVIIVSVGVYAVINSHGLEGVAWILLTSQAISAVLLGFIAFKPSGRNGGANVAAA